jgi:MYXO-CTERM domain-containing protein
MKNKLTTLGALALTAASASAAISFSTSAAVGLKANDGTTNIASGTLVLLVVDTGGAGFLDLSKLADKTTPGAITTGSTSGLAIREVNLADASTTVGQTFGGDLILGSFSAAGGGSVAPGFSGSIVGYENKPFALVWFTKASAGLSSGLANEFFGIASGADWTLPSTDSGAYTFSGTTNTTTSVYWQLASATSAAQIGSTGFFSGSGTAGTAAVKSAAFQVVPEPSAALLGALGALGLLRRRRI